MVHLCQYPLRKVCEIIKIPRSSYYYRLKHPLKPLYSKEEMRLVIEAFHRHHGSFGRRHLKKILEKEDCHYSEWKISRILKMNGLQAKYGRKKIHNVHTSPHTKRYIQENLYAKLSSQEKKQEIWSTDFTEIKVENKTYYVCGILSIQSKVLVGYAKSSKNNTAVALEALNDALERYEKPYMILTDRGSPFVSKNFHRTLEENGILHSMSRPHRPADNIFIETFWQTMKVEMGKISAFTKNQVDMMFDYYFYYYNHLRPHSSIGYKTPMEEWNERH
ncbi:IS3 family transposase [Aedoeadaptatus ivorii]|uniref:IS3 family transposase n=1 Tax=Aedoeadaptatus ivorii TaxID=54006 RepID=UPI002F91C210